MDHDGITPYMRMLLSPSKRKLLVVISAIIFGLLLFISMSDGQTKPEASFAKALQFTEAPGTACVAYRDAPMWRSRHALHGSPTHEASYFFSKHLLK